MVETSLKRLFGDHVGLDTPFSEFRGATSVVFEDDRPFFAMGLKSSLVNDVTSELNTKFSISLDVTQLFETPTPRTLRASIARLSGTDEAIVGSTLEEVFSFLSSSNPSSTWS